MFNRSITLLFILTLQSSSSAFPNSKSRVIRRRIDQPNVVIDLNATNFDLVLKETPASFAIVEFFAHWCPACLNYKPQYEKVAKLFNGANAVHPGIVLLTRVDCSNKINNKLCDKFSIHYYPLLLWGPPLKFIGGHWNGKKDDSEFIPIEDERTAEHLLIWINTQLGSSYGLEDEKFENENLLNANASDSGQIVRAIYDVEEATTITFDIMLEHKMIKSDTRATFIKFLQMMVAHNPSRRCRKGSAEILVNFDDLYPTNMLSENNDESANGLGLDALRTFQICGKQVPRGYWMYCRGSRNDTRGFGCGLWVLLHSLSVRVDDGESQLTFSTTCDFILKFFICEECRKHFYEMCSSVSTPFNTTRDFVLWLWTAHNKVNERLMKTESFLGTVDPKFPKRIWPPNQLCPACYADKNQTEISHINWDHDELFKFLTGHYGNMLVSRYTDKDTEIMSHNGNTDSEELVRNAFVVPVGAAMAIALASCLFGAVAYVWRSQQKRKTRRNYS